MLLAVAIVATVCAVAAFFVTVITNRERPHDKQESQLPAAILGLMGFALLSVYFLLPRG